MSETTREIIEEARKSVDQDFEWRQKRIQIGEERTGVEEGFIKRCDNFVDYFQMNNFDETGELPLTTFFHSLTEIQEHFIFDTLAKLFTKKNEPLFGKDYRNLDSINDEKWEDINFEATYTPPKIAFALGYVIGQMIDITDPDIQKDIEAIKKAIKDKQLLPYLPREKKGGSHEEK